MNPKSFKDFLKDKYSNYENPLNLNNPIISKIGLFNLFEEDIAEYESYLQRVEKLKSIPKYAL